MATNSHARSSLRRTACDRCRHSKLKCYRDENRQECARCLRLELRCEVAPAKPPGRPRKTVSTPTTSESINHAGVASPQFLRNESQSPSDVRVDPLLDQNMENSSPVLDDSQRGSTLFHQTPMPSHMSVNGFSLTTMAQFPDVRIPEWYETTCFDSGPSPGRDPLDVHNLFTVKLDRHECLKELSQLNVDLHVQWEAIQELARSGRIDFATFCNHPPPSTGDGVSLAEKLLIMSQRYQQAITNLNWVVKNEPKPLHPTSPVVIDDDFVLDPLLHIDQAMQSSSSGGEGSSQNTPGDRVTTQNGLLETPFACALVSCYVQIVSLWEIMFVHVQKRIDGADNSQVHVSDPDKGIRMGSFFIFGGRLQSMFYCQAVLYFLDNIDRGLGILPEQRKPGASGLLSHPQHFNLLQKELGGQIKEGEPERLRVLKDLVEKTRLFSLHDVGW
ncbi:uncharacterized protein F4822DRAFT_271990 [Hypoxylon trugodes]|uniref:uncharacterized protein n=1 Tax=Hypoxylon trugodes TaxID=326681 RepID=UPI002194882C|nr:uncharacterized protein F4822DRAFT_271990 [Hypoxylon trugodes]KAI1389184.1 hypothetical protein F4822DRAFT_271990 [Hypoxylon trugodes]